MMAFVEKQADFHKRSAVMKPVDLNGAEISVVYSDGIRNSVYGRFERCQQVVDIPRAVVGEMKGDLNADVSIRR